MNGFTGDDHERADLAPRIPADEQGIDALLRAGGEQWRAQVPAVAFERPSSRFTMLGRGARITTVVGIAAAVVAIVLAGAAVLGRAGQLTDPPGPPGAATVAPSTATSSGGSAANGTPSVDPSGRPITPVESPADPVGTRSGWPTRGVIVASGSAPGLGGIRIAWEVKTGKLLLGVPESLLCHGEQVRLRLTGPETLQVQVYGGSNTDQGCSGGPLRVLAFSPPSAMNLFARSTVTSSTSSGTVTLPPLGGVSPGNAPGWRDLPSVSTDRAVGVSPYVAVGWQPVSGRVLVTARYGPGCGGQVASAVEDGADVRIVLVPSVLLCAGPAGITTHAVQLSPRSPSAGFTVTIVNNTSDAAPTSDAFRVPATLLAGASEDELGPQTVRVGGAIDEVGRTADGRLFFRYLGGECPGTDDDGVVQTTDQGVTIRWEQGVDGQTCSDVGITRLTVVQLLATTDPALPLTVTVKGQLVVLPPVGP